MRRWLYLASIVCIMIGCSSIDSSPYSSSASSDEHYKVILLLGQSNMAGMGKWKELPEREYSDHIKVMDYSRKTDMSSNANAFGPETGLAHFLSQEDATSHYLLIKYAIGGSSLMDWSPHYDISHASHSEHPEFGALFDSCLMAVKNSLPPSYEMTGICWMQGESDAQFAHMASTYFENITAVVQQFRTEFEMDTLPFIMGEINPPPKDFPYHSQVKEAQQKVVDSLDHVFLIPTNQLDKWEDELHYSSLGLFKLGQLFGQKLVYIQQQNR